MMRGERRIYILLLSWIVLGYLLHIDFTQMWGCLAFDFAGITKFKIAIISTSVFLFTFSLLIQERKKRASVVMIELITWFTLLLILKGGYALGYAGVAKDDILIYDFIGLLLRLCLLSELAALEKVLTNNWVRRLAVILITFLVIYVKVNFFSIPLIGF